VRAFVLCPALQVCPRFPEKTWSVPVFEDSDEALTHLFSLCLLHTGPGSRLNLKGLKAENVFVHLIKTSSGAAEYLKLNPQGRCRR